MKNEIWILTADAHKARVFKTEPLGKNWEEIKTFIQPDTILPEQDLVSDNLGRRNHGSAQPRTNPKDKRIQEFARDLTHFLEAEHKNGSFYKLGLVAEPHMLGELRSRFSDQLADDISFEIGKNMTQFNPAEFRQHLPERLAPSPNL